MNIILSFFCLAGMAATAWGGSSATSPTALSGYALFDTYENNQCGVEGGPYGGIQYTYGYALNTCMPWDAKQAESKKLWVKYTADMSCQTITMTWYTVDTCASDKTAIAADIENPWSGQTTAQLCSDDGKTHCYYEWAGGLCSTTQTAGYSQYAYCDYSNNLPNLNYVSVMMPSYSINLDNGCIGTPNKITAYPADVCLQTATSMSQKYSCTKTGDDDSSNSITASFTTYSSGNCKGNGNSVGLSGVCSLTSYSDDDYKAGSTYTANQNSQYVCQGYSADDDALSGGAIAGITIGVVVFVVLLAGGIIMFMSKKGPEPEKKEEDYGEE